MTIHPENSTLPPLISLDVAAKYIGYASARSLSTALAKGFHLELKKEIVAIGRRKFIRQASLEAFVNSRAGK
jgi:hypothetical protein